MSDALTPHQAARRFADMNPTFNGVACVLSYQPAGRGGRLGLRRKETRFRIEGGSLEGGVTPLRPRNSAEFHQPVGALIDICGVQLGTHPEAGITIAPDLKTPEQKRDLADVAWLKRASARPLVQAAGPVVVIPATAPAVAITE